MSHLGRKPGSSMPSNATATKRIKKEIADLAKESLGDISLTPNESNIFLWRATIPGPQGSPYEGGMFDVDIRVPENYPFAPPSLQFMTKVYHCNINANGGICLDLLKNAWSPALSLYKVILSLSSLLTDPNPSDPLVPLIAQELQRNKKKHDATAKEWVRLYAKPKVVAPPPVPKVTPFEAAASRSTTSRPKAPSRLNPSFTASASATPPPAQLAGTRRTHAQASGNGTSGSSGSRAIVLSDDSDDDDAVVVLPSTSAGQGGSSGARAVAGRKDARSAKRARVSDEGGGGSGRTASGANGDDVIVVDD